MAENAQTLTRKEAPPAPVTGRADKSNDRVTDAEGEQSVLALALRRPKADPARAAREHGARYPVVVSQSHSAEKDLAQSEGCHLLVARLAIRSMERGDLMGEN